MKSPSPAPSSMALESRHWKHHTTESGWFHCKLVCNPCQQWSRTMNGLHMPCGWLDWRLQAAAGVAATVDFSPLPTNLQTLLLRQLGSRTAEAYITLPYWHIHKARVGNGWCGMSLWRRQRSKALTCIFLRLFLHCIEVFTFSNDPLGHYGWYRESIITCLSWPGRLGRLTHRDRSPAMAMPITWPLYCTPRDPGNEISSNTHLLPNHGTS